MAFSYLPAKNYVGSSGYDASGNLLTYSPTATKATRQDYPVFDITSGKYVSVLTGQPYTGKDPWQGKSYSGGVLQTTSTGTEATGDATKDYKGVNIEKSPALVEPTEDLLKTFKENAAASLKGFSDYLNDFKSDLSGARTKTAAATDITPTVTAATEQQKSYADELNAARQAYQDALNASAANQRNVVAQATDLLPSYDEATNTLRNLQLGAVQANLNRYKLGTGTPTSYGGYETAMLAKAAAEAAAPFEMAKINQRYNILGQMALPVEQQLAGQRIAYAGGFLPSVAGAEYSSANALTQYIQSLKQAVANMSLQNATAYLTAAQVPDQIKQAVLSGQTRNLAEIASLYPSVYYQGLQYLPGASLSQPEYYSMATGGYPASSQVMPTGTRTGTASLANGLYAANAPVQVGGAPMGQDYYNQPGIEYNPYAQDYTNAAGWEYNADLGGIPSYTPTVNA